MSENRTPIPAGLTSAVSPAEPLVPEPKDDPTAIRSVSSPASQPQVAAEPPIQDLFTSLMGETLDHFEILDCIGIGGMGRVFRGRDTRLDRLVAIKVLSPDLAKDGEICRRFEQEAKASARMDDPAFAHVYHYGQDRGLRFIVMEFVDGEDLRRRLCRVGPLASELVIDIGLQMARGLAHAAEGGVVHRDIKPSNIILTPAGVAKLVDMGLARNLIQQPTGGELTQAGVTLGTFDYISPEQARDPRIADVRSDIYSLGCTMYHVLTGQPPFPEGGAVQKLLQHQNESPADPRTIVSDIPQPLVAVLAKMMAKEPADRYASAELLVRDLTALQAMIQSVATPKIDSLTRTWPALDWDRHWTWLGPTLVFFAGWLLFTLFDRSQGVVIKLPLEPSPNVTPRRESDTGETPGRADAQGSRDPARGEDVVRVPADGDLQRYVLNAKPGQTLELLGDVYRLEPQRLAGERQWLRLDKSLTIRRAPRADRAFAVLRVRTPATETNGIAAGTAGNVILRVRGAEVVLEGIHLELEGVRQLATTGIRLEHGRVEMRSCRISADDPTEFENLTLLELAANQRESRLRLERTLLTGGAEMLRLAGNGDVNVQCDDCVIVHGRTGIVRSNKGRATIRLNHVTVLGSGPFLRVGETSGLDVTVTESVVAAMSLGTPYSLVQFDAPLAPATDGLWWRGMQNIYRGFAGRWLALPGGTGELPRDPQSLRPFGFSETDAAVFTLQDEPFWWQAKLQTDWRLTLVRELANPSRAFCLNATLGTAALGPDQMPRGVRLGPWEPIYAPADAKQFLQLVRTPASLIRPELAKDQTPENRRPEGTNSARTTLATITDYAGLQQALAAGIEGQDIVLAPHAMITCARDLAIAARGEVVVRSSDPQRPGRIVLRQESGVRRLFQLASGARLRLADLSIEVGSAEFATVSGLAAFECAENSQVTLEHCRVEVGRDANHEAFTIFRLQEGRAGNLGNSPGMVRLQVESCQLRSAGNLLHGPASSLWQLQLRRCFAAVQHVMVRLQGAATERPDDQVSTFETQSSTLVLFAGLINTFVRPEFMAPMGASVPRAIAVTANQSAFLGAAPVGGAPLLRVLGGEELERPKNALTWTGGDNLIAGFDVILHQGNLMDRNAVENVDELGWLKRWRLDEKKYHFAKAGVKATTATSAWGQDCPTPESLRKLHSAPDGIVIGVNPDELPRF